MLAQEKRNEMMSEIHAFVDDLEKKYGTIEDSSYLRSLIGDFAEGEVIAHKVWAKEDIRSNIYGLEEYRENEDDFDVEALTSEAVNILNQQGGKAVLEDCTDIEWEVICEAVREAINKTKKA